MFRKSRPTADEFKNKLSSLITDQELNVAFLEAFDPESSKQVKAFFSRFCLLEWLSLFYFQKERRDVRFFDLFMSISETSPLNDQAFQLNEFFMSDYELREATVMLTEDSMPLPVANPVPFNKLVSIALRIRNNAYNRRAKEAIESEHLIVLLLGLLEEVQSQLGCARTKYNPITGEGRAQFSCISREFEWMKLLMERL